MSRVVFDSKEDMNFALKKDAMINNGSTQMMQDLNVPVPVAKGIWSKIGSDAGIGAFNYFCLGLGKAIF